MVRLVYALGCGALCHSDALKPRTEVSIMDVPRFADEQRGFTLVEVMITVVIIGVLAALAIYGIRAYLSSSKSAEAKQNIGAITRAAVGAYQKELAPSEMPPESTKSSQAGHRLCGTAPPVPAAVPAGVKYQPNSAAGEDFNTGDEHNGWQCLNFELSQPTYFQLSYAKDASPMAPDNAAKCATDCFEAGARGDLDGDGLFSNFAMTGHINAATGSLKTATAIYALREDE